MTVSESGAREGYRMTELGELPEDWDITPISHLCSRRIETVDPVEADVDAYVGLEHVDSGEPHLYQHGTPDEVKSSKSCFEPGDVLYGKLRPYLDKAVVAPWRGICSTDIMVFIPHSERVIDGFFLASVLHTRSFLNHAIRTMSGVNHPRTSWSAVGAFKVPVPPLSEQKRIAAVLQTVQQAKERTEAVIQAARELKKSLLKYLFTYGPVPVDQAEDVELKDTIFGQVRTDWATQSLGDIADSQYGYTESACEDPVGPKFLRITDINDEGYVSWPSVPYCPIGDDDFEKYRLVDGDILVARIGATTGKTTIVKDAPESVFASYLIRLQLAAECGVKPEYAFYFTQSPAYWSQVIAVRGGKLKGGISASVLKQLQLPVPSLDKQTEIDSFLSAVDSKIVAEEDHRRALEELFNTLLNDLMTAKIRVNDLELGEVDHDEAGR
jgi:type I restriction enzyme S subunit